MVTHIATTPLLLVAATLLASVLLWYWQLSEALHQKPLARHGAERYPSITVIRPVRGADVGADENFRAALDTGYPGEVETLFIFDSTSDPGWPIAQAVVLEHERAGRPGRAEVLVAGPPPPGRTGKLHAMMVGAKRAQGELVAFGDSDTRPSQGLLRALVETLLDRPDAGSAFAPVLVNQPVHHAGDALYAIMQNALYSPLAADRAGPRRELPFIMGQLMVFKRRALDAIGGVGVAEGQLVDDMYIGRCIDRAGYRNVMISEPLCITTGGMTLREFLPIYQRWMMFSHNGLPLSFSWRQWLIGIEFFVGLFTLAGALLQGDATAAVVCAAALAALTVGLLALQRQHGGAPIPLRLAWTPLAFFLLAPVVLLSNLFSQTVSWRGRVYSVDAHAALATPRAPGAKTVQEL